MEAEQRERFPDLHADSGDPLVPSLFAPTPTASSSSDVAQQLHTSNLPPTRSSPSSKRTRRRSTLTPEQVASSVQSFRELSGLASDTDKVDKDLLDTSLVSIPLNNNISLNISKPQTTSTSGVSGSIPGLFELENRILPRTPGFPLPSPAMSQVNGGGMAPAGVAMPMSAGQQMDMAHLYRMVEELGGVLKHNREMTQGIIKASEDLARRAAEEGHPPTLQEANGEIAAARTSELELELAQARQDLAKEKRLTEILRSEQIENTKLIGEYETAVGTMVEQIRNCCQNQNMRFLAQRREYNKLLQDEKDQHLESRLERDRWMATAMRFGEMIRTAYKLRCEEDDIPANIVASLQHEVRVLRNMMGLEDEKPEEETGYEILRTLPQGSDPDRP